MITDIKDLTSFKWATVTGINPIAIKLDGDTAPLALIPETLVDPARLRVNDRVRVELSLRKVVIHGVSRGGNVWTGTLAQRDAAFGVPANATQRKALHDEAILWYRTDKGWWEQYFTTLADGAVAGQGAVTTSGWYPLFGKLPEIQLGCGSNQSYPGGGANTRYYMDRTDFKVGTELSGDTSTAATGGTVTALIACRVDLIARCSVSSAQLQWVDFNVWQDGVVVWRGDSGIPNTVGSYRTLHVQGTALLGVNGKIQPTLATASTDLVMQARNQANFFKVRYVEPPFVNG